MDHPKSLTEQINDRRERHLFRKQRELVTEFIYLYKLQCKGGLIRPSSRIEKLKHTKGYDEDVIFILSLMKLFHKFGGKKISNSQLILIRGDAFNQNCNENFKLWNQKNWNIVCNQKQPKDYTSYLENNDFNELNKNSFLKYKGTAFRYNGNAEEKETVKTKYISFLKNILQIIEDYDIGNAMDYPIRITSEHKQSLELIKRGFIEFVNSLNLSDRKREGETNIDMIKRKNAIAVPEEYCGEHTDEINRNGILDILLTQYSSIFCEGLGLK